MRVRLLWLVGPSLLAAVFPAWGQLGCPQATCWVATNGSDINGNGSSASPFQTIQRAVNQTLPDDTVRVRPGTYNECFSAYFEVNQVPVPSDISIVADDYETAGRNNTTIIDGTGVCDDPAQQTAAVYLGDNTLLRGFTIKGGGYSGIRALGHVTISRNVITGNSGPDGGGVYLYTGYFISSLNSQASIDHNVITDNIASTYGGGAAVFGWASDGFPSDVVITQNTISGNQVGLTGALSLGGGLAVWTYTYDTIDESSAVISRNMIDGNTALATSTGGAPEGGGAWVTTAGFGIETIDVNDANQFTNNDVDGFGGGLSVWGLGAPGGDHVVTVEDCTLSANTASLGGGGLSLYTEALDLTPTTRTDVLAQNNEITGNQSIGNIGVTFYGGGGLLCAVYNERTNAPDVVLAAERNVIRGNSSASYGGGASLISNVCGEDCVGGGVVGTASSKLKLANNLVVENGAIDSTSMSADGGGVYAYAFAQGAATSDFEMTFNTISSNQVDPGSSGGVALEAVTALDTNNVPGTAKLEVSNSIVAQNEGFGIEYFTFDPFTNAEIDVRYNDVFGHGSGNYGVFLGDRTGQSGNISEDPELSPTFVPPLCSATIDAGDPLAGTFDASGRLQGEPQPNGRRANMGHLGLTAEAVRTLPDITGDGIVDGVDVLRIATSFGALSSDAVRFIAAADRDGDGQITGEDLSYVAAFFGSSCP